MLVHPSLGLVMIGDHRLTEADGQAMIESTMTKIKIIIGSVGEMMNQRLSILRSRTAS